MRILAASARRHLSFMFACLLAICGAVAFEDARAQSNETENAFVQFLAKGDYSNANFYLQNGLIDPATLETGRIFYTIVSQAYWRNLNGPNQPIAVLHEFLTKLRPFDINALFRCGSYSSTVQRCSLLDDLAANKNAQTLAFFADLGLNLNQVHPKRVAATFYVIERLGVEFSLTDIQLLSQKGMVFGDELFEPAMLASMYERSEESLGPRISRWRSLKMPGNYLSLNQFNFMDALIIALGNEFAGRAKEASRRDSLLCQYVTFVASQMRPSFDYLNFVLANRESFRAAQIGERQRSGGTVFERFPAPCVQLMAGMARNHARLDDVIALFGARGDVETARWLLSFKTAPAAGGAATNVNQ